MSDLPTRDEAMMLADLSLLGATGNMATIRHIVDAYADGRLIDPGEVEGFYAAKMALLVAKAQLERGENPPINTTAALVFWLDELLSTGEDAK